ncbi:histidine phosphatase family protein [Acaryochloris sp. IP29b_bin.148]|uniref:histidine phosphatase family protein n=1 Tax=Acaryochloris sp. IP29b_bin.148 TaxID=2969218 RepID=UPI0026072AFF|nr:histidine phosphatase family protein [Acaryochloris sp. IP29b_bin.148]
MKILLIRHAESLGNRQQQMSGQLNDPLSPHGVLQAQVLAQYLSQSWLPTHLYSSPLSRAMATADLLMAAHLTLEDPLIVERAEALMEIHNGIFQGLTWLEAEQQYPQLCQQLMTSTDWIPIPEGETWQDCCDRTQNFLQTLYQSHAQTDQIWIVTHGGILQYLIAAILGTPVIWNISIKNTALFEFELNSAPPDPSCSQRCRILRFNQRPHLGGDHSLEAD